MGFKARPGIPGPRALPERLGPPGRRVCLAMPAPRAPRVYPANPANPANPAQPDRKVRSANPAPLVRKA